MATELPYQTYEKVTGKTWTGGSSPDVQAAYKQYGITDAPGSAAANLALQAALNKSVAPTATPTVPPPAVVTSEKAKEKVGNVTDTITNYDIAAQSPTAETKKAVEAVQGAYDSEYQGYQQRIASINRGILSPEEQAVLDNAQKIFDQNHKMQEKINKNYESGITIAGIRSGRQRYATEIEQGNIKNAMDQGITKLQELDAKAAATISQMRQAMLDKDFDRATKAFEIYQNNTKIKQATIFDIDALARKDQEINFNILKEQNDQISEYNKLVADSQKDTRTNAIKEYEYAKAQGYPGTFVQYEKAFKEATKAAAKGPSVVTSTEAKRFGLPTSIVGQTDTDIIQDLAVGTPPDWFREYATEKGGGKGKFFFSEEWLRKQWDALRNSPDMMVYRNTMDINKAYAGKLQSGGGSTGDNPFAE